nr:MAG TPA: hypothetical protein [Caudoviricetes sp.]
MGQSEIALQLTLEAMKQYSSTNSVTDDKNVETLAKCIYTLYNSIYNNLFKNPENSIDD